MPANIANSARGPDENDASGGEEDIGDRSFASAGRADREYDVASSSPPSPVAGLFSLRQGRMSRATRAGLQHKEMLKSRKRQLAAVLGALSHGDTLALDQALSASYPFVSTGLGSESAVRIRLSRRREARAARAYRAFRATAPPDENVAPKLPSADFTVVCHSASKCLTYRSFLYFDL